MEKQKTTVRVAGKDYALVSTDSPEHLNRVAAYVDRQMTETMRSGRIPANTAAVLTAQQLGALKPSCILIELASRPGGIPEADCRALGLAYHFAAGLPGLCAPETAGRLYADCVLDSI